MGITTLKELMCIYVNSKNIIFGSFNFELYLIIKEHCKWSVSLTKVSATFYP